MRNFHHLPSTFIPPLNPFGLFCFKYKTFTEEFSFAEALPSCVPQPHKGKAPPPLNSQSSALLMWHQLWLLYDKVPSLTANVNWFIAALKRELCHIIWYLNYWIHATLLLWICLKGFFSLSGHCNCRTRMLLITKVTRICSIAKWISNAERNPFNPNWGKSAYTVQQNIALASNKEHISSRNTPQRIFIKRTTTTQHIWME